MEQQTEYTMEQQQQENPKPEKFQRVIDLGDGSGIQRFEADTMEELVDKLAKAQEHATRKIREQARQIKTGLGLVTPDPEKPMPNFKPRQRSPEEEWKRTQELGDPSKARDAVRSIIEDELGAPLDQVRQTMTAVEMAKRIEEARQASNEWLARHKNDYYPCEENRQTIVAYLEKHKMAMTADNIEQSFQDLRDSGLLVAKPEPKPEAKTEADEGIPPRQRSSSLRPSQSAGQPKRAPTLTWADIDKMSPDVYAARLRDPSFRRAVDDLPRR